MRFLRQSTQADVVIGPVWATADGALKADLAYNASGINCDVYKGGTKADVTLADSAGDGYFRAGSGEAQYILTLSTGLSDTIGRLRVTLSATGYYMKPEDFMVLDEAVYDWLFGTTAPNTATPLDAAGVRAAVGLASANLDTQLAALPEKSFTNLFTNPRLAIDSDEDGLADSLTLTTTLGVTPSLEDGGQRLVYEASGADNADVQLLLAGGIDSIASWGLAEGDPFCFATRYHNLSEGIAPSLYVFFWDVGWGDPGGNPNPCAMAAGEGRAVVRGTVPAGAVNVGFYLLKTDNLTAGDRLDVTLWEPVLAKKNEVVPYFDGSRDGCRWLGTTDASTSICNLAQMAASGAAAALPRSAYEAPDNALLEDVLGRLQGLTMAAPASVLYVGDSLTAGYYATLLATAYRSLLDDALGLTGTYVGTTDGTTAGVSLSSVTAAAAELVVIELGTNDLLSRSAAEFQADLQAVADAALEGNGAARLIFCTLWNRDESGAAYDAAVRAVARSCGGSVVDLAAISADSSTYLPSGVSTINGDSDGWHPNDLGHARIAAAIAAQLKAVTAAEITIATSEIADAVCDEALSGHTTAGTVGKALADAAALGTPLDATGVRAAVGLAAANLDTQLAALPTDADVNAACDTAITDAGLAVALDYIATACNDLADQCADLQKVLKNRTDTDPETGIETVYDDDDETPLYVAPLYEDVAGTVPYSDTSTGINRRDRLDTP